MTDGHDGNGHGTDPPGPPLDPPPPEQEFLAPPLWSCKAEQSVLGALLLVPEAWPGVLGVVTVSSFFLYEHKLIWNCIEKLNHDGVPADLVSAYVYLHEHSTDDNVFGGLKYLNAMAQSVPSASHVRRHAQIVRDKEVRRDLLAAADLVQLAARQAPTSQAAIERMQGLLGGMTATHGYVQPVVARTLDLHALLAHQAPQRHWFIPGWLHSGPALFAAAGGTGKTLLAQQAATAGALGLPFIGTVDVPFRSMLWACEDDADELWRRQEAISRHFEVALDAPADNLVLQSRMGVDNLLMTLAYGEMRLTRVYELLRQQLNDLRIDVFWADNLAHLFGGDEVNRGQVTMFINALAGLVTGRPFAVPLLAHTARHLGSEFAGSAAWENAVRMRWYLGTSLPDAKPAEDDEDADDVRYLAKRKANYTSRDYVRFTMADGVLVPDKAVGYTSGLMVHLDKARAEKVTLEAFGKLRSMGIAPTDGKNTGDYLPRQAVEKKLAEGYTKEQIKQAMDRLMAAGKLVRGHVGFYSNRTPKLGLVLGSETLPGVV